MYQPTYIATPATISGKTIAIIQPAPHEHLTALLNEIGKNRIVFKHSIIVHAVKGTAVMRIMQINRYPLGCKAYVEVYKDCFFIGIEELPAHVIESIIERLRLECSKSFE